MSIQMVDLKGQYLKIKNEIDSAMQEVLNSSAFINGSPVRDFSDNLANYLEVNHVIPCANGTDALQVAFMALGLQTGDEVIVPCFTYVATAEVIALLGLKPILVDVRLDTFEVDVAEIEKNITSKTKAIVPVHLFGQCADMDKIMAVAEKHNLYVVEDAAQAIGAKYTLANGQTKSAGCIGHIGTTSFFPSKNLGCYGDGGAIFTNDADLAEKIRIICNHGQKKKYYHSVIGVNSRLDSLQAAVLNIKLKHLDEYSAARNVVADFYDKAFADDKRFTTPVRVENSTHVFHQYTLILNDVNRENLKEYLSSHGIPSMIYYPVPLNEQEAYKTVGNFPITQDLCSRVLALPISTEMSTDQLELITQTVLNFS